MSYVDLMGDTRWVEADHVTRVESGVRSETTHTREHVLIRRSVAFAYYLLGQMLPAGHPAKAQVSQFGRTLTPQALAELQAAAAVFDEADVLAAQARADAARLDAALDYEEAQAKLALLADRPYPLRTAYPVGSAGDAAWASAKAAVDALNASDAVTRAAQRVAPQAVVSAATADTLALVNSRPRAVTAAAAAAALAAVKP